MAAQIMAPSTGQLPVLQLVRDDSYQVHSCFKNTVLNMFHIDIVTYKDRQTCAGHISSGAWLALVKSSMTKIRW